MGNKSGDEMFFFRKRGVGLKGGRGGGIIWKGGILCFDIKFLIFIKKSRIFTVLSSFFEFSKLVF